MTKGSKAFWIPFGAIAAFAVLNGSIRDMYFARRPEVKIMKSAIMDSPEIEATFGTPQQVERRSDGASLRTAGDETTMETTFDVTGRKSRGAVVVIVKTKPSGQEVVIKPLVQ
jgi:hypothetical protein